MPRTLTARFDGKTVVITGAASGIGRATATLFARQGAKVHVCDISAEGAQAVVGEIEATGGDATAHTIDVSDAAAVEALAATVFEQVGAVDVLFNNAGIGVAGPVEELTLEDWQRVIEVDLLGVIYGVHAFAPRMLDQGRPAGIINTASLAGLVPAPYMAAYSAAKFGVVGLTESLNAELAPRGVRVSAICPGFIDTPIVTSTPQRGGITDPDRVAQFFHRFGVSPDVVAKAVLRVAERPAVITTVPRWHADPPWLLRCLSPAGFQLAIGTLMRVGMSRLGGRPAK